MYPSQDRLTLDALLSDPLTQLVMRSDKLTPEDVARAFDEARAGLARSYVVPHGRGRACREGSGAAWMRGGGF